MASTLRLGAGLALLGCGALAAPSSRVAFVQHGVGEGENAIMHSRSSSKTASLTPQMLASAIARVMSLDARAELGTELPAGDIFNRPDGNVMVFVDGVRPQGSKSAPAMTDWLDQPRTRYNVKTDNIWSSTLENILDVSFDVTHKVENKGGVVCAAMDSALSGSEACYSATWVLPPHMANDAMEENVSMGPGVEVDLSTGLKTLRLRSAPGEKASNEEVVLDLGVEADKLLAQELAFLSLLPAALAERFPAREQSTPPLVIVYVSSLKAIRRTYGETSLKGRRAFAAMDAALSEFFEAMAARAGRRLTSQLVVGMKLKDQPRFRGRYLHDQGTDETSTSAGNSTSDSTNSSAAGTGTGNVTLTDITQYQLNLWTGVFLIFIGFMAIYATATMDVQPDSLLYAKFITDTSGGGLKTD